MQPKGSNGGQNGANYCAINEMFGFELVASKVANCQMHFRNDVNKALARLD